MEVQVSTTIRRPVAEVFEYLRDPAHDPEWISGIVSAQQLTPGPVSQGTRVRRLAKFLGRSIEYVLEITDYRPNQLIAMRSVQGPFPMEVDYRLTEVEGGTGFEIRTGGSTEGFYRLASPIMESQVKRSLNKDVAAIRAILEKENEG